MGRCASGQLRLSEVTTARPAEITDQIAAAAAAGAGVVVVGGGGGGGAAA
jgi:hypothetical protein